MKCEKCNKEHDGSYGSGRFCSSKCARSYSTSKDNKEETKDSECVKCNKPIKINKRSPHTVKCQNCIDSEKIIIRIPVDGLSKNELFEKRCNWQSARSGIRKHAERVYLRSDEPKQCVICGYDKHYEICHKINVSDFDGNTLINEINSLNNLIALCRNCHWEFDNGILKI